MKGLSYQLKNSFRDKLCMLTFLLPLIFGIFVNVLSNVEFDTIEAISFGIVKSGLTQDMSKWLEENGNVSIYQNQNMLNTAVNNPSTQIIGVTNEAGQLRPILSGDEWSLYKKLAGRLPQMYEERRQINAVDTSIQKTEKKHNGLRSLLIAITMVTAMFMGCTFNAMSIIGEKEDGITFINDILPMTQKDYVLQKMFVGFSGAILSTIITAFICIRIEIKGFILLLLLIILSSFIAAFLGLLIGKIANNMMVGILYIKGIMVLFIAPPILLYLLTAETSLARAFSYILPSSATFYGLMDIMNGRSGSTLKNILILIAHCIFGVMIYKKGRKRLGD